MTFLATTVTQVVFYAAFAIWLAFTFLIEPMILRSPSKKTAKTREDKGSGLLIYLSVFVAIITAFQFAVRHPAYGGSILTMVGLGLATQSAVAVLIMAVVCGIAYAYRIHVEEPVLARELGEEYLQYMGRTKRLIPFIF
jgi:protein-S-isoprenylcysteine O-methyltransferase Ste14